MSKYCKSIDFDQWLRQQRTFEERVRRLQDINENDRLAAVLQFNGEHKQDKSADVFKANPVRTCSYVRRLSRNGISANDFEAVPYYSRPSSPSSRLSNNRPTNTSTTMNTESYRKRSNSHAGMGAQKPLQPYSPNAARSRLQMDDFKRYYANRSVVQIGDRTSNDSKHYITTSANAMGRNPHKELFSRNPEIVRYQVNWDRQLRMK